MSDREATPYTKAQQLGRGEPRYRRKVVASPKQWHAVTRAAEPWFSDLARVLAFTRTPKIQWTHGCRDGAHVFGMGETTCQCGALSEAENSQPEPHA